MHLLSVSPTLGYFPLRVHQSHCPAGFKNTSLPSPALPAPPRSLAVHPCCQGLAPGPCSGARSAKAGGGRKAQLGMVEQAEDGHMGSRTCRGSCPLPCLQPQPSLGHRGSPEADSRPGPCRSQGLHLGRTLGKALGWFTFGLHPAMAPVAVCPGARGDGPTWPHGPVWPSAENRVCTSLNIARKVLCAASSDYDGVAATCSLGSSPHAPHRRVCRRLLAPHSSTDEFSIQLGFALFDR